MTRKLDNQDVDVFHRDILDEEHRWLHPADKPWILQYPDNMFLMYYADEEEACRLQREWRAAHGLDPATGKVLFPAIPLHREQ